MAHPSLFVVILEEGRAYTSLGKAAGNSSLWNIVVSVKEDGRVPASPEALERNTSLGLEKTPYTQDDQLSNVTGDNPAGISATSPWKSAYSVAYSELGKPRWCFPSVFAICCVWRRNIPHRQVC